ncbi:MAG: adhesin [Neisseria zoodegmatis]|uniref:ACP-like domain-containing protein n=1 Tax=Neisseria zoodegmatis TaxID=326523 RepID=UPI0026F17475|nr:adhesin [Neisseria zoodegmatis]MDO5070739.1 adhesin [Neisseria zoodegmatis]
MKILSTALLVAATLVAGVAHADAGQAVKKSSVSYSCQQGKKVKVTYGFNKQNLPVYASAYVNGKRRYMPVNLNRSDNVDTIFGDEDNFKLSTDYMTRSNHRAKSIMITSPGQEILFKGCKPRR